MGRRIDYEKLVIEKLDPLLWRLRREHGWEGGGGVIPCPACGGPMRYTVGKRNGRIEFRCEKPDCLALRT